MTACKDCKHCGIIRGDSPAWHNVECLAIKLPAAFDCYAGEIRAGRNPMCFEINDGNCLYFEQREEKDGQQARR